MRIKIGQPLIFGFLASISLLGAYLLIMSKTVSFDFALNSFLGRWYLFLPLAIGFGVQIGLYRYLKEMATAKATALTVASGGLSATAMVACCAHHLVDVLPLIGFAGVSLFLARYQNWFLVAGIISNAVGIVLMARLIRKARLN